MNKLLLLLACILSFSMSSHGQNTVQRVPRTKFEISGTIAASTNGKAVYINMGGPGIDFTVNKFQFSINMFPSIGLSMAEVNDGYTTKKSLQATPVLGTGLCFYYKRFILEFPFYYRFNSNTWVGTAGVGYKILKF